MGENIVAKVDEYGERHLMHHLQEAGMDEEFHILYEEKVAEVIEWLEAHTKHIRWSAYNKEPDDYRPSIVLMRGLVVIGDLELGGG